MNWHIMPHKLTQNWSADNHDDKHWELFIHWLIRVISYSKAHKTSHVKLTKAATNIWFTKSTFSPSSTTTISPLILISSPLQTMLLAFSFKNKRKKKLIHKKLWSPKQVKLQNSKNSIQKQIPPYIS